MIAPIDAKQEKLKEQRKRDIATSVMRLFPPSKQMRRNQKVPCLSAVSKTQAPRRGDGMWYSVINCQRCGGNGYEPQESTIGSPYKCQLCDGYGSLLAKPNTQAYYSKFLNDSELYHRNLMQAKKCLATKGTDHE